MEISAKLQITQKPVVSKKFTNNCQWCTMTSDSDGHKVMTMAYMVPWISWANIRNPLRATLQLMSALP